MNQSTLFGTPLFQSRLEIPKTNTKLKEIFLAEEQKGSSQNPRSNAGGWQSDLLENRQESCFKSLYLHSNNCLQRIVNHQGEWGRASWANVNRKGDYNLPHNHPNADWSSVYYVDAGDKCDKSSSDRAIAGSGDLMFIDPRGSIVDMGRANPKGKTLYDKMFGTSTTVLTPFTGLIVFFPSWLMHQVLKYDGETPRISVATNYFLSSL